MVAAGTLPFVIKISGRSSAFDADASPLRNESLAVRCPEALMEAARPKHFADGRRLLMTPWARVFN